MAQARVSTSPTDPGDRILNEVAAADFLLVSPRTLQRWRRLRGLGPPFLKYGKLVRYRESDLSRYLEASRRAETPVAD